ncbi:MAG: hypothetical protein AB1716_01545 [Planctomycetota bacterium]
MRQGYVGVTPDRLAFEVLPGLPPYGPAAEAFSASGLGTHREGLVVRFHPPRADAWVGNFQPGLTSFSAVDLHPDGRRVIVISGGQGYLVDPADRKRTEFLGSWYVCAHRRSDLLVLQTPIDFECIGPEGRRWRTRRLSWDGFRNVELQAGAREITGDAWSPITDEWIPFTVDLNSGSVQGGSYTGP